MLLLCKLCYGTTICGFSFHLVASTIQRKCENFSKENIMLSAIASKNDVQRISSPWLWLLALWSWTDKYVLQVLSLASRIFQHVLMEPIMRLVIVTFHLAVNFRYSMELKECPSCYSTLPFCEGIHLTITNINNQHTFTSWKFWLCLQRVRKLTARTTNCRVLTIYCFLDASSSDGSRGCKETACSLVDFKHWGQLQSKTHNQNTALSVRKRRSELQAIDQNCVSLQQHGLTTECG